MTPHLDALTLSRWADGLLAEAEQHTAAAHLAQCAECRARAAGQAQTARRLRQLAPETPPPHLARSVMAAISRGRNSEAAWGHLALISAVSALLGVLLLAAAWPDLARLLPALAGSGAPASSAPAIGAASLLDVPGDALAALSGSVFDWGSTLTGGAGAALLTGLVLLTGAAFAGLAQLLRPEQAQH